MNAYSAENPAIPNPKIKMKGTIATTVVLKPSLIFDEKTKNKIATKSIANPASPISSFTKIHLKSKISHPTILIFPP